MRQSRLPKTNAATLQSLIIEVLEASGGRARVADVMRGIEKRMEGKFLPGDLEPLSDGRIVWKNDVRWERLHLIYDGVLRNDSPWGIWELNR